MTTKPKSPFDVRLRELMADKNRMTYGELSRRSEIKYTNLSYLIRKPTKPDDDTLSALAKVLNVSTKKLVDGVTFQSVEKSKFELRVRKLMRDSGLHSKELAAKSGVTTRAIDLIFNLDRSPNLKTIRALAKALNTTIDDLIKGTELDS